MHSAADHAALAAVLAGLALSGCESGGHFTFLGYTTRPNYDTCIKTVYVPIFESKILLDETRRQIPFDLTRAVIREIEAKTPYKVVSDRSEGRHRVDRHDHGADEEHRQPQPAERNPRGRDGADRRHRLEGPADRRIPVEAAEGARTCVPTPGIPALDIPDLTPAASQPTAAAGRHRPRAAAGYRPTRTPPRSW